MGAYHTADVPYWFDTLDNYNKFRVTRVPTQTDRTLIDQMSGSLIAMAETGSPSTKAMAWPAWTSKAPQYLVIGDTPVVQKMNVKRMDWLAAHPAAQVGPAPVQPRVRD